MNPLDYAEQIAYSSKEVLRFTYEMAVKFKDTPGVYVECGVAAGAQIIAMAYGAPNKTIYAFDSFEGIPLPSNRDDQMPGIAKLSQWEIDLLPPPGKQVLKTSGATAVSLEDFTDHLDKSIGIIAGIGSKDLRTFNLLNNTMVIAVKGWFEDTMPKVGGWMHFEPTEGINLLRLDGDLYNSTYVCLKHLYPRTIKGSIVIIDDYELKGCKEAIADYFSDIKEPLPNMMCVGSYEGVIFWYV